MEFMSALPPPSMAPETIQDKSKLLCGTCDLPEKCLVLNMIQFNGKHGCPRCYQSSGSVKTQSTNGEQKGSVWTFPFDEEDPDGPKRTHDESVEEARQAGESATLVLGWKGPSWLSCVQGEARLLTICIAFFLVSSENCSNSGLPAHSQTLLSLSESRSRLLTRCFSK